MLADEGRDSGHALVGLGDRAREEVEDVDQVLPLERGHVDAGCSRPFDNAAGIVEQHLRRTHLDQQWSQTGQVGEQRTDPGCAASVEPA